MRPFRWDLSRQEQLGGLVSGPATTPYAEFYDHLDHCCARILEATDGAEIVFVGRSPENLFDYLSGLGVGNKLGSLLGHVNLSNRFMTIREIRRDYPKAYSALKMHFVALGLNPASMYSRGRTIRYVDLVSTGSTFGQLARFLFEFAREEKIPWKNLVQRIGFVGITWRKQTSPSTWRWQQHAEWTERLSVRNIRNVSASPEFCSYVADYQSKVTGAMRPVSWADHKVMEPPRLDENLKALRFAHRLYQRGQCRQKEFSAVLTKYCSLQSVWLRGLVGELRRRATLNSRTNARGRLLWA